MIPPFVSKATVLENEKEKPKVDRLSKKKKTTNKGKVKVNYKYLKK